MVLSQEISLSLSIIALVGIVGAGVAIGSGVGEPPRCQPPHPPPFSHRSPSAELCPSSHLPAARCPLLLAGMMTMAAVEADAKKQEGAKAVAHSPLERVVISRGFAASAMQH